MVLSSLLSLGVCLMPKHQNPFLFLIGIFTIYLVLSGNRILLFQKKKSATFTDKLISGTLFFASILMLFLGTFYFLQKEGMGILYLFFGVLAMFLAWRDFKFFRNRDKSKIVKLHITKMTGAFTASITVFLVAGIQLNGLIYWILPSILAGIYITYWTRKIQKPKSKKAAL
jgi:FtsH-binding integral membrane protein